MSDAIESQLIRRFCRYLAVTSQGDTAASKLTRPHGQQQLAAMMTRKLTLLGLDDVVIDKQATVTGVKPGNRPGALCIGFIAHLARFSPAVPDFDLQAFHDRQQQTLAVAAELGRRYPDGNVTVTLNDVYSNAPGEYRRAIDLLLQALAALAVVPKIIPMRGGTDGAALSAKGIFIPDYFTGAHNFHLRFEFFTRQRLC